MFSSQSILSGYICIIVSFLDTVNTVSGTLAVLFSLDLYFFLGYNDFR